MTLIVSCTYVATNEESDWALTGCWLHPADSNKAITPQTMWRQRNPIKFSLIIPESGFTWWDYNMLTWRIDVGVEGR
jgi:hypothetical protein